MFGTWALVPRARDGHDAGGDDASPRIRCARGALGALVLGGLVAGLALLLGSGGAQAEPPPKAPKTDEMLAQILTEVQTLRAENAQLQESLTELSEQVDLIGATDKPFAVSTQVCSTVNRGGMDIAAEGGYESGFGVDPHFGIDFEGSGGSGVYEVMLGGGVGGTFATGVDFTMEHCATMPTAGQDFEPSPQQESFVAQMLGSAQSWQDFLSLFAEAEGAEQTLPPGLFEFLGEVIADPSSFVETDIRDLMTPGGMFDAMRGALPLAASFDPAPILEPVQGGLDETCQVVEDGLAFIGDPLEGLAAPAPCEVASQFSDIVGWPFQLLDVINGLADLADDTVDLEAIDEAISLLDFSPGDVLEQIELLLTTGFTNFASSITNHMNTVGNEIEGAVDDVGALIDDVVVDDFLAPLRGERVVKTLTTTERRNIAYALCERDFSAAREAILVYSILQGGAPVLVVTREACADELVKVPNIVPTQETYYKNGLIQSVVEHLADFVSDLAFELGHDVEDAWAGFQNGVVSLFE